VVPLRIHRDDRTRIAAFLEHNGAKRTVRLE
jgi:hypothetical protein